MRLITGSRFAALLACAFCAFACERPEPPRAASASAAPERCGGSLDAPATSGNESQKKGSPDGSAPPAADAATSPGVCASASTLRDPVPNAASDSEALRASEAETSTPSAPRLPAGILPGLTAEVPVPGDRALRVVHASAASRRAVLYLPGMCGSTHAMDPWSALASHYGTLIILSADLPCEGRPGLRWPKDVSLIQARIDRALEVVREARGGLLDTDKLSLIGYSQGAHRGEALARAYPERYTHLLLAGAPEEPVPYSFRGVTRVAIAGGEREDTSFMRTGTQALKRAGVSAEFFLFPKAYHGDYGPSGPETIGRILDWLFNESE
jgi:predicted esterase